MNISGNCVVVVFVPVIFGIAFCSYASKTVLVNIGEAVSLHCLLNTSDIFVVQWNHEGKRILLHDRNHAAEYSKDGYTSKFVPGSNSYQLKIFVDGAEDLGRYGCLQFTQSGKLPRVAWTLKKREKHYSTSESNSTTVMVGNSVILDCSSSTDIPLTVHWEHNGMPIRQNNFSRLIEDYEPLRLQIHDVSQEDAGNYSCFSYFTNSRNFTTSWRLLVEDKELGDFTIIAPLGKSVDLTCTLEKSKGSLVAVQWEHSSRQILHHDASSKEVAKAKYKSTITDDESIIRLNISIVGHADDGKYSCVSFFRNGIGTRNSWILQVEGKRKIGKKKLLLVDGSTELECYSDHSKNVTAIKWIRNDEIINKTMITGSNDGSRSNDDPPTLYIIMNATLEEAGNYFCFSYYENYTSQETAWTVQIQGNTQLTLSTNASNENETISAECCVDFGMTPMSYKIDWLLDGMRFSFNGHAKNFQKENTEKTFCNLLEFRVTRTLHGKSLDCWIQNELNRTSSIALKVFYPPSILKIQHYAPDHIPLLPILSNEEFYITCTVDAHPDPVVTLEQKSAKGSWGEISRNPVLTSRNNTVVEWKFSLSKSGKTSYRCIASNGNGSAAISQEIVTNCFPSCLFDGIQGVVLLVTVTVVGMIIILMVIFKIAAQLKGMGSRYTVSAGTESALQQTETESMACSTTYENCSGVNSFHQKQAETENMGCSTTYENYSGVNSFHQKHRQVAVPAKGSDELVGDENYSLVTINETSLRNGDKKVLDKSPADVCATSQEQTTRVTKHPKKVSQNPNKRVNRRPTPKRKPKQRMNQRTLAQKLNQTSGGHHQRKDVLYATVNKEKPVPCETVQYATVQKHKCATPEAKFTSSDRDQNAPADLTTAETMYGKVRKKKIWRTDQ